MQMFWQDLRYGARMLLKKPGFTLIAILTLGLGIGANTAIFSVIDSVLLRPLPFKAPERLVSIWSTDLRNPLSKKPVSSLDMKDWSRQSRSIESIGSWFTMDMTLTGGGEPMRVKGKGTDGDLLGLLGVSPMLGRVLRPGDHYAAVLSYSLWQRRFNSDPNVVGQSITLGNQSHAVVGVMPAGFQFPIEADACDLWFIWDYAKLGGPMYARDARLAEAIGRLRAGVTLAEAQAEMETIAASLSQQYPDTNKDIGVGLGYAAEQLVKDHRQPLLVLFGAVSCVLLIACVNVANLMLARATGRRREMTLRAALGASRIRLGFQLLTESLLLALTGGILGVLMAMWGLEVLVALNPIHLPGVDRIGVDSRMLGFTLLASLLTGVLFGLAPALHASRIDLSTSLKDGERTTEGAGGRRLRSALVIAEIAFSFILLIGAALLINSFWRLLRVNPGFDPHNVLTFRVSLSYEKYDVQQAGKFFQELQTRLQTIPGVRGAANVFPLPLNGDPEFDNIDLSLDTRLDIEGRTLPPSERPRIDSCTVQPDYFHTMGIRLAGGRDFDQHDIAGGSPVAIINESLARRYFPGENPIGKRLRLDSILDRKEPPLRQVVGVVSDVKQRGLNIEARPQMYIPFAQAPFQEMFVVLKTDSDPVNIVGAVRAAVLLLDKEQPIFNVKTLEQRLGLSLAGQRFNMLLLALFSAISLVLAAIGLYGVLSYAVAERTHEIGVRLALGAQTGDVLKLVIGQGMRLAAAGVALGIVGAFGLTRLLESLLFGVSPTDPVTFVAVALLLVIVALFAVWIPARQATKVDPMIALRFE